MFKIKSKRGQLLHFLYLLVLVIGFIGVIFLYNYLSQDVECSGLKPVCGENKFCGVDWKCQEFPDLSEQQIVQRETEFSLFPGIIFF